MPRVLINKDKYIESDAVLFIEGRTKGRGLFDSDIAKEIGLSPPAYCQRKKNGRLKLGYMELVKVIRKLNLPDEDIIKLMRGKF